MAVLPGKEAKQLLKLVPNEGECLEPETEMQPEPQPEQATIEAGESLMDTLKRMFWQAIDPSQPTVEPSEETHMSVERMCKYGEWLISTLSDTERKLFLKYCEIEEDYLNDAREQAFVQGYLAAINHMARCQNWVPERFEFEPVE